MQNHGSEAIIKNEFDKQDKKLGEISEVLTDLHNMALDMNHELKSQEVVIDGLGQHIDNTNLRIQSTTEKINKLIKSAKNNCLDSLSVIICPIFPSLSLFSENIFLNVLNKYSVISLYFMYNNK